VIVFSLFLEIKTARVYGLGENRLWLSAIM
jgi:hypothetical protein